MKHDSAPKESFKRNKEEGDKNQSITSVYLDNLNVQERPQLKEQHEEVEIFEGKKIKVGKNLTEVVRHDVLATIVEFRDIFAFSPNIMCHKLDIKPEYKPVKQKLRHQGKEKIKATKEKVNKLLKASFI